MTKIQIFVKKPPGGDSVSTFPKPNFFVWGNINLENWKRIERYTWAEDDITSCFAWGAAGWFKCSVRVQLFRPRFHLIVEGQKIILGYLVKVDIPKETFSEELFEAFKDQQESYSYPLNSGLEGEAKFFALIEGKENMEAYFLIAHPEFFPYLVDSITEPICTISLN